MRVRTALHWLLFAVYVTALAALPLALLWGRAGLLFGIACALFSMAFLWFQGTKNILERLGARSLCEAESPVLFTLVAEYSRRLSLPPPNIALLSSPALNAAALGFSRKKGCLVFTEGALKSLDREALSATVARLMTHLHSGNLVCETWLCRALIVLDRAAQPLRPRSSAAPAKFYTFRGVLKQTVLYPLGLFPSYILLLSGNAPELDLKSVKLSRLPLGLAKAFRLFEATHERLPLVTPLAFRHLFLLPPKISDPVARLFFSKHPFRERITHIESLRSMVPVMS